MYRERPIQLVDIKDDGIFEITSEGISFLSSLKNQSLSVLSVTGPYRSGKSFLANLIMNNMSGFKVGATINACTKGLWVWGKPIDLDNGKKLLIIDCEGLGSVEKDRTHNIDMKIFTLSVLLSSCLIYNTKHAISEDKIEELSNVANLSKRINISKDMKENLKLDYADFFPELIWVLRDFSLDKGNLSAKDYLEECLKNVDIDNIEGGETKNISREIIRKNFKKRDCYTLVMPTTNEIKLKNLDNEPLSSLRPEFISQVEKMIQSIKNTILPKKINNIELDGEALFGLLQTYVESINNEENPVILSALENVLLSKAKNISEKVYEVFKDNINCQLEGKYPVNVSDIYNLFFDGQNSLIDSFCKNINDTLSSEQIGNYILKLFGRMKDELEIILENNISSYDDEIEKQKNNINKLIQIKPFKKIEESKIYFLNLSNQIQNAIYKFSELEIANDFTRKIIQSLCSVLQINLFDNLRKIGGDIEDIYNENNSNLQSTIDDLNIKIKSLTDSLTQERKITELKEKEISETKIKLYEMEIKNDSLKRKNKEKEKEYMNNIDTEIQKYQKMENSYMQLIQQKDDKISVLEEKMNNITSKSSLKSQALNKENIKLMYELKKLKEDGVRTKSGNIENYDSSSIYLQPIFKAFQENVIQFKDDINKLNQERENIFKQKYIEKCTEEINSKTKNWAEEIKLFLKKQIENITNNYTKNMQVSHEEIERLTQENNRLTEENYMYQKYKVKYEGQKNEVKTLMSISENKDEIIKTHKQHIQLKEEELKNIIEQKDNIEVKLGEYISKYNILEMELEEIFFVIEAILEKKKDKYNSHLEALSLDSKEKFNQLKNKYKFKLTEKK